MTDSETTLADTDQVVFAQVGRSFYPLLCSVFVGIVLISNVAATKAIGFGPVVGSWSIITDGAFVLFPLSYVIGDVLSEVYGYRATNRAILTGFAMEALACLVLWSAKEMPAAEFYKNQEAFSTIVESITTLMVAGLAGYLAGQTLNALVVVWMKKWSKERHLWARLVGSTVVGEFADSLVFCTIAARALGIETFGQLATYTALGWGFKTLVEIVMLPVTYRVIAYIKKNEPTYRPAPETVP